MDARKIFVAEAWRDDVKLNRFGGFFISRCLPAPKLSLTGDFTRREPEAYAAREPTHCGKAVVQRLPPGQWPTRSFHARKWLSWKGCKIGLSNRDPLTARDASNSFFQRLEYKQNLDY